MKRIILGIACMVALGTAAATAQNNNNCVPANCNQTQCVSTTNCNQTQCVIGGTNSKGKYCPFDNLNLTDAQKKQLQALNQKFDAQKRELGNQKKENKARNEAVKSEFRKQAQQMQSQKLAEIKKILTPEQYTKYLENCHNSGKAFNKDKARGGKHHAYRKDGKRHDLRKSDLKGNKVEKNIKAEAKSDKK